jgi:hypothetical protein
MSIQSLVKKLEQAKLSWMQGEEIKIEFIDACIDLGKQAIADLEKQEHGSPEDMYVGMHKHLNCPHCGGSGHIDDVAEKQEPVAHFGSAYVNENGVHVTTVLGPVAIPQDAKLYTHPQPKREPLTDEQIEKIIKANMIFQMNLAGIRQDFEAAHGIKEPT